MLEEAIYYLLSLLQVTLALLVKSSMYDQLEIHNCSERNILQTSKITAGYSAISVIYPQEDPQSVMKRAMGLKLDRTYGYGLSLTSTDNSMSEYLEKIFENKPLLRIIL
jgi:hypothetical protein